MMGFLYCAATLASAYQDDLNALGINPNPIWPRDEDPRGYGLNNSKFLEAVLCSCSGLIELRLHRLDAIHTAQDLLDRISRNLSTVAIASS